MLGCKACEIMRNEAYFLYAAVKHDKLKRSRWAFFNSLIADSFAAEAAPAAAPATSHAGG